MGPIPFPRVGIKATGFYHIDYHTFSLSTRRTEGVKRIEGTGEGGNEKEKGTEKYRRKASYAYDEIVLPIRFSSSIYRLENTHRCICFSPDVERTGRIILFSISLFDLFQEITRSMVMRGEKRRRRKRKERKESHP